MAKPASFFSAGAGRGDSGTPNGPRLDAGQSRDATCGADRRTAGFTQVSPAAPDAHACPRQFPDAAGFVLHEFLGRGSSGSVWRATQEGTLREVALKFLAPWQRHGLASMRFAREAEIAASLEHENIARVFGLRAVACARRLCRLTGDGELSVRLLVEALATEADIARLLGDDTRTLGRLTEASTMLGGTKAKAPLSLTAQPLREVAQAWERYGAWMEQGGRFQEAVRCAFSAHSRLRECVAMARSDKMVTHLDHAEALLLLAEMNAPQRPEAPSWAAHAAAALQPARDQQAELRVPVKQRLAGLETRRAAATGR